MAANRDQDYLLYKSLLEPVHEWAFLFALETISLRFQYLSDLLIDVQAGLARLVGIRLVGSLAEGLSLNVDVPIGTLEVNPFQTDVDIMTVDPSIEIWTDIGHLGLSSQQKFREWVSIKTRPGYLRIGSILKFKGLPGKALFSTNHLLNNQERTNLSFRRHGPATQGTCLISKDAWQYDWVKAFKCFPWPAESWRRRRRPSGWPSTQLIEKIVADGCHVVHKPHPKTSESDAEFEFRYSFSVAEVKLCKSLSIEQKQCMKLFKLIVLVASDDIPFKEYGFSSYHLKTVFLWLCEKLPATEWENLGKGLLALLDKLLGFLKKGNLPNYFIPENNMVDHISASDMQSLIGCVGKIRDNPIAHLFFSDYGPLQNIFGGDLGGIFRPVLEVINCKSHDTRTAAQIQALQNGARSLCRLRGGCDKAVPFIEAQRLLLQSLGIEKSQSSLLDDLFTDFKESFVSPSLDLFCRPFSLKDDYERFFVLRQLSNFLTALGHLEASVAVLQTADALLVGDQDSETRQARHEINLALLTNYLGLGNFEELDKCLHKIFRHCYGELSQSDVQKSKKFRRLWSVVGMITNILVFWFIYKIIVYLWNIFLE